MEPRLGIISTILEAFKGERSIYGVYHLLKGKKSAQTIQDGTYFSVLSYFGIFPRLDRSELEKDVEKLIEHNDAIHIGEDCMVLTDQGLQKLERFHLERPSLVHLKGWYYHLYTEKVWLRLRLFLQSLSHLVEENPTFFPITHQSDVQSWVRKNIPHHREERRQWLTHLHNELACFLSTCQHEQALIFVHQLSGKSKVGYTIEQLADQMGLDSVDTYLLHSTTLHKLFTSVEGDKGNYPVLTLFVSDLKQEFVLTESARQTLSLLEKGNSLGEVSKKRRLKQNTIEDHVIEIVLQHAQFPIRSFVNEETEMAIQTVAAELQTSRLRELKEKLPSHVSYFMIRLVLARKKVEYEA